MTESKNTTNKTSPGIPRLLLAGATLILGACGSMVHDSGPGRHVDVSNIQNPVPRLEPRSKYGNPSSYVVQGRRYYLQQSASNHHEQGIASWYGTKFHGRRTSSGEPYDMYAMTAAHKTLPIPVYAEVTNQENGRKIIVRINDRGPFVDDRIIDLSYVAAKKLGITAKGTGRVTVRTIDPRRQQAPSKVAVSSTVPTQAIVVPTAFSQPTKNIPPGQIYLQVGAFTEHQNATQLQQQLVTATTENVLINRKSSGEYDLYRVRIGPLASDDEVQRLRLQLSRLGMPAPHIVVE